MKRIATALTALLVLASLASGAAVAQNEAYAGTNVSFGTSANAVTDYSVGGESMLSSVKVQSASSAERSGIVSTGTSLSAVTSLEGAGLSLGAQTQTSATLDVEGSASMEAHDNGNGVLVVRSGGDEQYVQANLSSDAEASAADDSRVTVTTADGVKGTFIVVGDGEVTVNDDGNVAANLGRDGTLVFRAYPDGKSDEDASQEQLIADGQAAGEVHVMARDGETVTDTVAYTSETTIEARQTADGEVEMTVDRAAHEGKVVITKVSESTMDAANGVSVAVDGEAAAEASSYRELEGAIGSEQSKYLVRSASGAQGSAEVLVAVNHFSERTVTMSESDGNSTDDGSSGGDGSDGSGDATSTTGQPGFGVLVAVLSLLAAALLARYRG